MLMNNQSKFGKGKSPAKFVYTMKDLAALSGLTLRTCYTYVEQGKLDPKDLSSVAKFLFFHQNCGIFMQTLKHKMKYRVENGESNANA